MIARIEFMAPGVLITLMARSSVGLSRAILGPCVNRCSLEDDFGREPRLAGLRCRATTSVGRREVSILRIWRSGWS